jgi:hypothetical protein
MDLMSPNLYESRQTIFTSQMQRIDKSEVNAAFHQGCRVAGSMRPNDVHGITVLYARA